MLLGRLCCRGLRSTEAVVGGRPLVLQCCAVGPMLAAFGLAPLTLLLQGWTLTFNNVMFWGSTFSLKPEPIPKSVGAGPINAGTDRKHPKRVVSLTLVQGSTLLVTLSWHCNKYVTLPHILSGRYFPKIKHNFYRWTLFCPSYKILSIESEDLESIL